MKSGWAMVLDLIYKVFEAFVLWRKQNDDWFNARAAAKKAEADAEAARLAELVKEDQQRKANG